MFFFISVFCYVIASRDGFTFAKLRKIMRAAKNTLSRGTEPPLRRQQTQPANPTNPRLAGRAQQVPVAKPQVEARLSDATRRRAKYNPSQNRKRCLVSHKTTRRNNSYPASQNSPVGPPFSAPPEAVSRRRGMELVTTKGGLCARFGTLSLGLATLHVAFSSYLCLRK